MANVREKEKLPAKRVNPLNTGPEETGTAVALYDPGEDAGKGLQDVDKDEYAIPFIKILDPKSPQCKPASAGGIPGAKGGSIINMATNEIYDGEEGIHFIPVHRDHHYVEWIPKEEDGSGGGFVGIRADDDPLVLQLRTKHGAFGKLPTDDGHELAETYYLYGLMVEDGQGTPGLIGFSSTQIKKYRNFMSTVMNIKYKVAGGQMVLPPMWAHLWRFTTQYEQKGSNSWYGWKLALVEEPAIKSRLKMSDPLYVQARELFDIITSGRATVKHEQGSPRERQPGEDDDNTPM